MELVLGTENLIRPGGGETYLLTVAAQLQRLGHGVTLFALEHGPLAQRIRDEGAIRVAGEEEGLPDGCDAALVQASTAAYALAERYPAAPQVFVSHSEVFSIDTPPQLPGVVAAAVAMSERVERHLRALALKLPVHRLSQPVDIWRFQPSREPAFPPRRVAAISNYLEGDRSRLLLEACAELGLECELYGREHRPAPRPELVMAEADVVVGKGRVVLEAMACGRPAYVYDWTGSDGWVTPERYPELEADAFAGLAEPGALERERLVADLAACDPGMGVANRDLAVLHHSAQDHAERIVEILGALPSPEAQRAGQPLAELGRLAREQWRAESWAFGLNTELAKAHARAADAETRWHEFQQTARYRLAQGLMRPADVLRRR